MGNRSRFVVVGSAAAGVAGVRALVRAGRRARLRRAAEGFVDVLMPSVGGEAPSTELPATGDEAHAPGHQHLPLPVEVDAKRTPSSGGSRPFAKHQRGLRHPGKR